MGVAEFLRPQIHLILQTHLEEDKFSESHARS